MFCFITDNNDFPHIVNLKFNFDKKYSTFCGKYIEKNSPHNLFASDNIFNGLCEKCINKHKKYIISDELLNNSVFFKTRIVSRFENRKIVHENYKKYLDPSFGKGRILWSRTKV
jgi:hypothetical protein